MYSLKSVLIDVLYFWQILYFIVAGYWCRYSIAHVSLFQLPQVRMSRLGEIEILLTNCDSRDTENFQTKCHDADIV